MTGSKKTCFRGGKGDQGEKGGKGEGNKGIENDQWM